MQKLRRSLLKSYNVAVIAVVLALLLTELLWQLHKLTIYPFFFAAVMVSSWYGGFKPGLLTTILSAFVCGYFFLPLIYYITFNGNTLVGLVQFVVVSLLICTLNSKLRSAQAQAQMNARSSQQNYERLLQSQENLRAAREQAEAANRSKDDFLAVVSHELRTPMTSIVGWAGMLQTGMLDASKTTEAIETIERNANLQLQLIEDLLDISRIVRGELSLSFENVDMVAVINAAIEIVQPAIDAKSIKLECVLNTLQEIIWGDFERLQQVVCNLLSNAIKFTPNNGRVEIRLSNTVFDAQIQISDTGLGISHDFLPYVFERFRTGDNTSTRLNKGLGLGLAIVHHIVELHGGTIQADSRGIGLGATFTVKLPSLNDSKTEKTQTNALKMKSEAPAKDAVSLENATRLNGLRVLVVDDEADTRKWINVVLTQCGASVFTVSETRAALLAVEQFKPDVLVSDIGMPNEDGYALIRKIRELEHNMGGCIPAVALTGYARVRDCREAYKAGFQLHVAKPVRANELVAVVASLGKMSGKL